MDVTVAAFIALCLGFFVGLLAGGILAAAGRSSDDALMSDAYNTGFNDGWEAAVSKEADEIIDAAERHLRGEQ